MSEVEARLKGWSKDERTEYMREYMREYYKNKKQIINCPLCRAPIVNMFIKVHQNTKKCKMYSSFQKELISPNVT